MLTNRISVLIADDHALVRDGLRALIHQEQDIHIVGEASTGREAVELAHKHLPKVVIMDLAMPVLNGFEAMRKIRSLSPETKFVVLTAYCEEEYVDRCLAIGAEGIISKVNSYLMLCRAIRDVVAGRMFICPTVAGLRCVAEAWKRRGAAAVRKPPVSGLTTRETQVLRLVAEGAANKQVAAELGISIKTVEKHRQQLMDKLGIHDIAGLTRYAISSGVIESVIIRKPGLD